MIMSNENVVRMGDSLTSGDNVAAQDAFKSALTDKIGQALDDKRQTVANDWLNSGDELEATQTGENRFVHEWRNQTPNSWTLQPPSNDTAPTLVQGALNEHSIYDTRRQWFQLTRPLVEWGHVR